MKNLFIIAVFAMFALPLHAQDFRNITWGMTVEEVKKIEGGEVLDENEHMFVYSVKLAGRDALLFYKHAGNKVISAGYSFRQQHADKNGYINDYEALKDSLIKEYGGPVVDEVLWKNDQYKEDEENHGLAVGMGYLIYWSDWESGNTKIELALHGNNDLHVLAVNYLSKSHE